MPAAVGEGNLDGCALEDIARRHGLTLDAAGRFRDAWNEACRHGHTPRGDRAMNVLGDITAHSKNWQDWSAPAA